MMKLNLKKIFVGTLVAVFAVSVATVLFIQNEINHYLGGNTIRVDNTQFNTEQGQLAITNVSVLSVDSTVMNDNQTVLIKEGNIEVIGPDLSVPEAYTVIDGSGQYLIPGFIDSHVHIKQSKNDLLLYVANGVTHIAEMTGMEEHFYFLDEINEGALGPDIYISSPKITSLNSMNAKFRSWFEKRHKNYLSEEAGREAVRYYKSEGYDAIKMSSNLDADIYFAMSDEAKKVGIPVVGHIPIGLSMDDVYQSGQSQIAHIDSLVQNELNAFGWYDRGDYQLVLDRLRKKADQIAADLKSRNIVVSSTAFIFSSMTLKIKNRKKFLSDLKLEYQNPGWLEGSMISSGWLPDGHEGDEQSKLDEGFHWEVYYEGVKILTDALIRNNVTITAGTDAHGADGMIAGFSLHEEFEVLSHMGLTNSQILHSATQAPAEWLKSKAGKIEAGYQADLVLLNENPLVDIKHTQSIVGVFVNGQYLDRAALDKILASVKDANNLSRIEDISEYLN